mgnify:CR=1 FL=1
MNMKLIQPNDPQYFTDTSDEPYDRHHYEFVYSNGESRVFNSWEETRCEWFSIPSRFKSHINILDLNPKSKKSNKGFK